MSASITISSLAAAEAIAVRSWACVVMPSVVGTGEALGAAEGVAVVGIGVSGVGAGVPSVLRRGAEYCASGGAGGSLRVAGVRSSGL